MRDVMQWAGRVGVLVPVVLGWCLAAGPGVVGRMPASTTQEPVVAARCCLGACCAVLSVG